MPDAAFGSCVLVRAEVARVIVEAKPNGAHRFKQAHSARDGGRYVIHEFGSEQWPGLPIVAEWEPHIDLFDPDPVPNGQVLVRLRRLEFQIPESGIVIGRVRRYEGTIAVRDDGPNDLVEPIRTMMLLEVALKPGVHGKARIGLAHPNDVAVVPAAAMA